MSQKVWYEAFGSVDAGIVAEHVTVLRSLGLTLEARPAGSTPAPGIVFFDALTPQLNLYLQRTAGSGADRVLAVASDAAVTAHESAWTLLESGASELLVWDETHDPSAAIAARISRWHEVDQLVDSPVVRTNLAGLAKTWRSLLRQIAEIARFTDASVLLLGESGTGKELIARLIHALDARRDKRDLIVLDCTTVVPELAGSEFFGHERGAFTGAAHPRDGAFRLADGGTLFLDEIGDLPLPLQAQLLRAVQERTYKPVGGNSWCSTRFRLICATHRPLDQEVGQGRFRADLYYRIAGVVCHVPPLRDRPEDIVPLFQDFVAQAADLDEPPPLDEAVRRLLLRRSFPGNVRELQQLARRTACRHVGTGPITIGDIPEDERPRAGDEAGHQEALELAIRHELARGVGLKEISRAAAAAAIRVALSDANGSLHLAAKRLRVTDRALQLRRAADPPARPGKRSA